MFSCYLIVDRKLEGEIEEALGYIFKVLWYSVHALN